MASFLEDNPDLRFYFEQGVDWETLASLTEVRFGRDDGFDHPSDALAFYRDVASAIGTFAAQEVAPHAAEIDRRGVTFEDGEVSHPPRLARVFEKMSELQLFGLTLPRELGGANAPMMVYFIGGELIARGDVATMSHYGFHGGIAMAMLVLSFSKARAKWTLAPAESRGRAGRRRSLKSCRGGLGAAWTSRSPMPAATWPRSERWESRIRRATGP